MGSKAAITPVKADKTLLSPHCFLNRPALVHNMGDDAHGGMTRRVGIDQFTRRSAGIARLGTGVTGRLVGMGGHAVVVRAWTGRVKV